MVRSHSTRLIALTLSNVLLPIAVLVFALGFFPFKPILPGLANFDDGKEQILVGSGQQHPVFDRLVFMVVDALRSDFVYGHNSGFDFTQSLIRDGAAVPFTAHAAPPTVTMPRIKALTTGSVPSFADLIFNLDESDTGSSLAGQDTWLAQIRSRGGKLVFYGDDTWLRLFPGDFFERADGTSSFFVSDFTEVDNNVTRHVPDELLRDDWNAMILHYLGLDHIGHKTGPQGPNMLPKQREMDGIVRQIYEAMEKESHQTNTLLVLAGDHGMNAGGNHGGSGPGETEPALLFASPKFKASSFRNRKKYECPTLPKEGTEFHYYSKVQQSDLVPTLAALLNFPTPKNSLGVFIKEVWGLWPTAVDVVDLVYQNAKQMMRIVEVKVGEGAFNSYIRKFRQQQAEHCDGPLIHDEDERLACLYELAQRRLAEAASSAIENTDPVESVLLDFLELAQDALSNAASTYNIPQMASGIFTIAIALAFTLLSFPAFRISTSAAFYFGLISVLYGIMMFATSYVEEEQQLWYWLTPCWVVLLTIKSLLVANDPRRKLTVAAAGVLILAIHRISVRWNQTGQKFSGEPDIVHTFFPNNTKVMWSLILTTYVYICFQLMRKTLANIVTLEMTAVVAVILVTPSIVFKLNFTQADAPELVQGLALQIREWTEPYDLVTQAQLAFTLLGLITLAVVLLSLILARSTAVADSKTPVRITLAERLHYLICLFLVTQSRAPNIPLLLGFEIQHQALWWLLNAAQGPDSQMNRSANVQIMKLTTSILLFSHVGYFCTGGSNSISSVDLSNAYNGVGNYNIFAVGVLLFASNWTAPIYWCSSAVLMTFSKLSSPEIDLNEPTKGSRQWVRLERKRLHQEAASASGNTSSDTPASDLWLVYISAMTTFIATSLLAIMAACTVLRTHLFIWTVFSPKYLYAMAWSIGWHLLINIFFGGLLRYLGQIA
ncbi:Hypothetical protein R9X50_00366600 [Acrodontium crateriforme]|uniref:GPI ethanolamine phosphate transferase 2 n=1 Tax=Acrodontium crateriforme TaxID=150365 RepID=A0AAQ3M6L8_9PEZI|nr:Hypothetical protein R9X50_00366600 [Acrodontium crateriforme]